MLQSFDLVCLFRPSINHFPCQNPENVDEANESFRELAAAYEILSNPQSREKYDSERHGRRGDFDFDDFGDGEGPRRRAYRPPKPAYDTYRGHGEEPDLNQLFKDVLRMVKAKAYAYALALVLVAALYLWCKF